MKSKDNSIFIKRIITSIVFFIIAFIISPVYFAIGNMVGLEEETITTVANISFWFTLLFAMVVLIAGLAEYFKNKETKPNQLKQKETHNKWAIMSFIFSLPLGLYTCLLSFIDYPDSFPIAIGAILLLILVILEFIAFILGVVSLSISKRYVKKNIWCSIIGIILPIIIMSILVSKVINSVSDSCGNSWCHNLNTTITMNWSQQTQQP